MSLHITWTCSSLRWRTALQLTYLVEDIALPFLLLEDVFNLCRMSFLHRLTSPPIPSSSSIHEHASHPHLLPVLLFGCCSLLFYLPWRVWIIYYKPSLQIQTCQSRLSLACVNVNLFICWRTGTIPIHMPYISSNTTSPILPPTWWEEAGYLGTLNAFNLVDV